MMISPVHIQKLNYVLRMTGYNKIRNDEIAYVNNKAEYKKLGYRVERVLGYFHIFWDKMEYYEEIDQNCVEMQNIARQLSISGVDYKHVKSGIWVRNND